MKKNILFILHIPPPVNGAAMVGKYITESDKINKIFEANFVNLSTSFSLQEIGKGGFGKVLSIVKVLYNVWKALRKKDYDLCYMTLTAKGAGFYKDFLIVLLLKLYQKKIIYHFHNKGVQQSSLNWFNDKLYRFVFKNTNSIVLAPSLYKDLQKYVNEQDVYICPNGIPDLKTSDLRPGKIKQDDICRFLFLSNMMQEKGVVDLLEACSLLQQRKVMFECHFIGAWSDITADFFNSKLLELHLKDSVFPHGKKYGDDKLKYFKNSDVFVFPTYYHNECFPLVLLEAMQQSLPIISTPEGGITDLVAQGTTGFLVPQKNVKELAEHLQLLVENRSLREQLGKAGRERFEELYTLSTFENRLCSILDDTIDKKF